MATSRHGSNELLVQILLVQVMGKALQNLRNSAGLKFIQDVATSSLVGEQQPYCIASSKAPLAAFKASSLAGK